MEQECAPDASMFEENRQPSMQSILFEGTEILFISFKESGFLSGEPEKPAKSLSPKAKVRLQY